jgi:hypothetical protein
MKVHGRGPVAALVCAAVAATVAWSPNARAFEVKHASQGALVRWTPSQLTFVVDPSVDSVVGGSQGVADAVAAWSGASGAPQLAAVAGTTTAVQPAVDGQNMVLFAANGFGPAGDALAVTLISYDDLTGDVIDADIVVNGKYAFVELAAGVQASSDALPVSTEGGDGAPNDAANAFDLQHVVTHEVGHALGLGDQRNDQTAMMYAYTMPGDATLRAPSSDDLDGLASLYGSANRAGCGSANLAGARTHTNDIWALVALAFGSGAWRLSRRRARVLVPVCAALVALVAFPERASSSSFVGVTAGATADASARVVWASTRKVDGLFQTTLDLEPSSCRLQVCPTRAIAHVWGGTIGSITQEVGERPAPVAGDQVWVAFARSTPGAAATDAVEATVVSAHGP